MYLGPIFWSSATPTKNPGFAPDMHDGLIHVICNFVFVCLFVTGPKFARPKVTGPNFISQKIAPGVLKFGQNIDVDDP